jgi:hypothetical protein
LKAERPYLVYVTTLRTKYIHEASSKRGKKMEGGLNETGRTKQERIKIIINK